jgi:Domain of unknown function (DUF4180)
MQLKIYEKDGTKIGEVCGEGVLLGKGDDIGAILSEAFRVDVLALHVANIAPDVFDLRTGILGELFQKLVNYKRRLAIVGDVSAHEGKSEAFAALVRESNRGRDVQFVKTLDQAGT